MSSLPRLHKREKRGRHPEKKKESLPSPLHSRAWSFALDGIKMKREAARSITLRTITKILLNAASMIHPASRGYIFTVWDGVLLFARHDSTFFEQISQTKSSYVSNPLFFTWINITSISVSFWKSKTAFSLRSQTPQISEVKSAFKKSNNLILKIKHLVKEANRWILEIERAVEKSNVSRFGNKIIISWKVKMKL